MPRPTKIPPNISDPKGISPPLFLDPKPALTGPCHDTAGRGLTIVPIIGSVDSEIKLQKRSKCFGAMGFAIDEGFRF
jgi:hypothetical protein